LIRIFQILQGKFDWTLYEAPNFQFETVLVDIRDTTVIPDAIDAWSKAVSNGNDKMNAQMVLVIRNLTLE
jgi:hypothetical protein